MKKLTLKPKSLQQRIDELELDIAARRADLDHYSGLFKEKVTSPVTLSSVAVGGAMSVFLLLFARHKLKARRIKKHLAHPDLQLPHHHHSPSFFSMATLMNLSSILSTALTVKRLFLKSTGNNRKNIRPPRAP